MPNALFAVGKEVSFICQLCYVRLTFLNVSVFYLRIPISRA